MVDGDAPKLDETLVFPLSQIKIPHPFPQSLKKQKYDTKLKKFLLIQQPIGEFLLLEDSQEMPEYCKFMNDLVSKKLVMYVENIQVTRNCISIMSSTLVAKKEDLGTFFIRCNIECISSRKHSMI